MLSQYAFFVFDQSCYVYLSLSYMAASSAGGQLLGIPADHPAMNLESDQDISLKNGICSDRSFLLSIPNHSH